MSNGKMLLLCLGLFGTWGLGFVTGYSTAGIKQEMKTKMAPRIETVDCRTMPTPDMRALCAWADVEQPKRKR